MPKRVVHVLEAGQQETSEAGDIDLTEEYRRDEEVTTNLSKQLSEIFGPILNTMILMGEFFGETTLPEDASRQRKFYISRYYCVLVVLGQWVLAAIGITTQLYLGFSMNGFLYLLITNIWYVQCASNTTFCLIVLPLSCKNQSRFAQFLSSFLKTATELDGLRAKALKGLAIACTVSLINAVFLLLLSIYYNGLVSSFEPWEGHLAIRVMEVLFGFFNSFAWNLPVLVYCVTCLVLERMFETLKKKVTSSLNTAHSFTIACLRQEHLKLCEVVELANKAFSPILLTLVALDIPLICVNVYEAMKAVKKWSDEADVVFMVGYVYWGVCISALLAVVCIFGNRVNEKVGLFPAYMLIILTN